jgi:hypothetical protein
MKYSEFKVEVEKMGFMVVEDEGSPIYVDKSKNGETFVAIGKHKRFCLDPGWSGFNNLTEDQQLKLYDLASELAKTSLAEREEEKRYRLQIVANLGFVDDQRFLNLNIEREEYFICSARQSERIKTIFTESEISQMDITGFEKVEVTPE